LQGKGHLSRKNSAPKGKKKEESSAVNGKAKASPVLGKSLINLKKKKKKGPNWAFQKKGKPRPYPNGNPGRVRRFHGEA